MQAPDLKPLPTYRLKRRSVMKVRPTWLIMVVVLLMLVHREFLRGIPMGMGLAFVSFVAVVLVPSGLLLLWRLGLLPPERVMVGEDGVALPSDSTKRE